MQGKVKKCDRGIYAPATENIPENGNYYTNKKTIPTELGESSTPGLSFSLPVLLSFIIIAGDVLQSVVLPGDLALHRQ